MINLIRKFLTALVCIFAASTVLAQNNDGPLKFKWGMPSADWYSVYVAKENGLFKQAGLDPEFFFFASGAPLLAGLKSESLDVVTTGLATVFALGQNIPLKMIYWEVDHAAGEALIVDPKSGINTAEDLVKAKAIGAPSGTCAQVSMVLLARKLGAKMSDLNVTNIAPPLYSNAFSSGAIQAGIAWSPFSQSLLQQGYKVAGWATDYSPHGGVCPVMTAVRPALLSKNPDMGLRLVQVKAKAMEMIAANPAVAVDAVVKNMGIPRDVAKAAYERVYTRAPSFAQQVDPKSPYSMTAPGEGLALKLQVASEALATAGSIPAPLSSKVIADAIDPSHLLRYMKGERK